MTGERTKFPSRLPSALGLLLLLAPALACDGDGDGDGDKTTCEQTAELACELACGCGDGKDTGDASECGWYYQDGATTNSLGRSRNACSFGLTRDACEDPTKTEELFSACLSALQEAPPDMCVEPETPDNGWAFVLPEPCFEFFECNEGPCLD